MSDPLLAAGLPVLLELAGKKLPVVAAAKILVDFVNAYNSEQQQRAAEDFLHYLAEIVGDTQQLFSDPYLKSPEGQRFWEKVVGCALDPKLAEKRQLFARALVNGVRASELPGLDKLRFVDLLSRLSAQSLIVLAKIHSTFEPILAGTGNPDWLGISMDQDQIWSSNLIQAGQSPFFVDASLRELRGAGLFSRLSSATSVMGKTVGTVSTEEQYYTQFTRQFARFVSEPSKQPSGNTSHPGYEESAI